MSTYLLLQEAHKLLHATTSASALEAVITQIAQRWCVSFGVVHKNAIAALEYEILAAITVQNTTSQILDINELLDLYAEDAISNWFQKVSQFGTQTAPYTMSMQRYAFLQANQDNTLSEYFLQPDAPFADISAALAYHEISPTPAFEHRQMPRQKI